MTHDFRRPQPVKGSNLEQRRAQRRSVDVKAKMRQAGSTPFDVELVDLSTAGFRTETGVMLSPGSRVWLTLPTFEALEATVAWRDHQHCGCCFSTPLHLAVLDHIVKRDRAVRRVPRR